MLENSINALIKFAPLMMPDLLSNAEIKTVKFDSYAIVEFYLDEHIDIHKLSYLMKREMEMTTLAFSYDKKSDLHIYSCFSRPKGGYMWEAYIKSFKYSLVDSIVFTVYTSMEQMFVELQDELTILTDTDNYSCEEEIDSSSFVLFFQ